jgi:hypothetical protein
VVALAQWEGPGVLLGTQSGPGSKLSDGSVFGTDGRGETILDAEIHTSSSEMEWLEQNASHVRANLPNGYCGRPQRKGCPQLGSCLTCPYFHTSSRFLSAHRQQAETLRLVITSAEATARRRVAAQHRRTVESLEAIIGPLEVEARASVIDSSESPRS